VRIVVEPRYVPEPVRAGQPVLAVRYHVTIRNESEVTVQAALAPLDH